MIRVHGRKYGLPEVVGLKVLFMKRQYRSHCEAANRFRVINLDVGEVEAKDILSYEFFRYDEELRRKKEVSLVDRLLRQKADLAVDEGILSEMIDTVAKDVLLYEQTCKE